LITSAAAESAAGGISKPNASAAYRRGRSRGGFTLPLARATIRLVTGVPLHYLLQVEQFFITADPMRRRVGSTGLAIAVGIAYFLAARLSLELLTKPDGVAVFWPAAGIATGVLIAFGPRARLPVAAGTMVATIVANLLGDRDIWSAIVFALCNAGEALFIAGLIDLYFGSSFNLDRLRNVLGLLAAVIVGTGVSGIGGTLGYVVFHSSKASVLTIWYHWFASDGLGIVTVAPLLIGLGLATRDPSPRVERIEGAAALVTLTAISGLIIFLPRDTWTIVMSISMLFPLLLWLAARSRPVFSATAVFIVAFTIVWTTTFGIGIFNEADFSVVQRILTAQAGILAISLCSLTLAALFSERRQHETKLRLIYETAPVGLAFLTPDCRYQQINRHLTEICGIPIADHIGRSVRDTVPQVAEQVENIVQTILRVGEPITGIEVNGQRPDGSNAERVWITSWHPLKATDGGIVGVNVVAEEITERKRAEVARIEAENALRHVNATLEQRVEEEAQERARLWNVSQDLLVVTEMDGRFVSVNPAWNAILGHSEGDLLNNTSEWLVHPDDRAKTRAHQRRVAEGDNTQYFENRLRDGRGSYRWLSWKAVAEKGQIYAVARDVTDLKTTADQLQIARRELAGITRHTTMGAMTASIAHELRQPLGSLINNANAGLRWLNRAEPDLDEASAALRRIVENGNRASAVIVGIRSMFQKDLGDRGPVNVNDLIDEVLVIVRGELDRHRVLLESKLSDQLPAIIADRTQIQQVILNLVINAVDAMSSVDDRKRILIVRSEMSESDHVLITVEDSGTGIEPSNTDRIFDAFFSTKAQGMGMGLSVCRTIIESHGGQLWFSARSPHGSSFTAKLPMSHPTSQ
jgi:PAS domain S-box-containing protein